MVAKAVARCCGLCQLRQAVHCELQKDEYFQQSEATNALDV